MIPCPNCGSTASRVRDVRNYSGRIRRSRVCKDCAHEFTTFEVLAVCAGRDRGVVLDMLYMDQRLQHELVNQPPKEVNG